MWKARHVGQSDKTGPGDDAYLPAVSASLTRVGGMHGPSSTRSDISERKTPRTAPEPLSPVPGTKVVGNQPVPQRATALWRHYAGYCGRIPPKRGDDSKRLYWRRPDNGACSLVSGLSVPSDH